MSPIKGFYSRAKQPQILLWSGKIAPLGRIVIAEDRGPWVGVRSPLHVSVGDLPALEKTMPRAPTPGAAVSSVSGRGLTAGAAEGEVHPRRGPQQAWLSRARLQGPGCLAASRASDF